MRRLLRQVREAAGGNGGVVDAGGRRRVIHLGARRDGVRGRSGIVRVVPERLGEETGRGGEQRAPTAADGGISAVPARGLLRETAGGS